MLAALNRIIIFVGDVEKCGAFFRDLFDLEIIEDSHMPGEWLELNGGGCSLAFHKAFGPNGPIDTPTGSPGHPHKIVFHAEDVEAMREELIRRGAEMGEINRFGDVALCDGADPEGHRFQISSR
ncbi:MAG: hypothetical protein CMJ18_20510 [Phycisphaeraceae bacterium]|nr:hypothetical protein [Phycisphaeraceae bacterium]